MSGLNVLLVEDDLIVQRVHQSMLSKIGCQVDIAMTGNEALNMVQNNLRYRVIFVDIGLPDIDGFDVIGKMSAIFAKAAASVAIFALTGYAGVKEREACIAAGAKDVLVKPIVCAKMRNLLAEFI